MNNFSKEPLSRVTFGAHPTCHDVNVSTASSERLDVIIGFNTGDLIWLGVACISYFDTPLVLNNIYLPRSYQLSLWAAK